MLIDSEDRRSEPNDRDMATRIASPRAASQAPRVRRMKRKKVLFCAVRAWVRIMRAVSVRRILSVAKRTIRRWVRCDIKRSREKIRGSKINSVSKWGMGGGRPVSALC